jgi:hypothetical protein
MSSIADRPEIIEALFQALREPALDEVAQFKKLADNADIFRALNTSSAQGVFHYGASQAAGWIRPLHLHPGHNTDPILCSLSASPIRLWTSPSSLHPFTAVSYAWGSDSQKKCKLTCNWELISVEENEDISIDYPKHVWNNLAITESLQELLLRVRDDTEYRVLWVDQICLNQQDLEEKAVQVKKMSEIYSAAINVLIWLGEANDDTIDAFRVMTWLW